MFRLEPDAAEMRASGERILDIIIRTFEQLPREAAYRFRNSRAFADFYEDLRREPRDWQQVISRLETEGPSAASIRTPRHSCRSAPMRSGMAATANPADLSPSSSAAPLGVRRHDSSRAVQIWDQTRTEEPLRRSVVLRGENGREYSTPFFSCTILLA